MGCCKSCYVFFKDVVRLATFVTALGGGFLVFLSWQHLVDAGSDVKGLDGLWFPLTLGCVGILLISLGLIACCGSWGGRTAPIHLYNGGTLVLLPAELALALLWWSRSNLLRQWALLDSTHTFDDLLDALDAHRELAIALGIAWISVQAVALLLGSCVGCCGPVAHRRRKHPWDVFWEEGANTEQCDPLLPQAAPFRGDAPPSLGYQTPPSHFVSPNFSPELAPRAVYYSSPQKAPVVGQPLASYPIHISNDD